MNTGTPCAVPGCPHRFLAFTLAWPWRCPDHQADHDHEHHRPDIRALGVRHTTRDRKATT